MFRHNTKKTNKIKYYRVLTAASLTILLAAPVSVRAQVAPSGTVAANLPTPLTLTQAVTIALKQQPQEYLARTQQTEAEGQKTIAKSQYLPTVTPSYQYQMSAQNQYGGTGYITGAGTGTTGTVQNVSTSRNTSGGVSAVTLSQTLFDSGAREVANAQARRAADVAKYNRADVRQQIVLSVTQDFYNLLRQIDQVKVAQADVDRYQQTVALTQAQATAGTMAPKDVLQAQANLASAQITLLQNRNAIRTASATLKNAMGVSSEEVIQPEPLTTSALTDTQAAALPVLPETVLANKTLGEYVQEALAQRPDLKQQQATVSGQELSVRSAKINAGLQVSGTYNYVYTPTNDLGLRGTGSTFLVGLSYPLFDGGNRRATVRVAQAQRDAAKNQLEQETQNVRLNVETYFVQRSEALQRVPLAQTAVQAAQTNYDAAIASRKAGVATIVDVTTAQATLTTTQNQYVGAIYDFYIADANLKRATGTSDETAAN